MITVWRIKKLAELIEVPEQELLDAANNFDAYCTVFLLKTPKKDREVLSTTGVLRKMQDRLYKKVFSRYLRPSAYSHGGIRRRSIVTNAMPHAGARFYFKTDIANFYPSISQERVFRFFRESLNWPEEVSSVCTRLCTWDHHLALGLVTSPILADQMFSPTDHRIAGACAKAGIAYTRFVDDITLSAAFDLDPKLCGIPAMINRILNEHGFVSRPEKQKHGRTDDADMSITGLRHRRGHLTVARAFIARLSEHMRGASALADGKPWEDEFYPQSHISGQIRFVAWVNKGLGRILRRQYRHINWKRAMAEAERRGLVVRESKLIPKPMA